MGSDSHPRILRLSPPFSQRIGYLHFSRAFRQSNMRDKSLQSFRYFGQSSALYASIRDFTADRLKSSRKRASPPRRDITLLRVPPRGIPGYSLFSGGRLFAGDRDCALARVPSALHCIFCFLQHSVIHSRVSRRALAQGILCAFPQCDTSQKGFHPLYTLSCRIARRNSSFFL